MENDEKNLGEDHKITKNFQLKLMIEYNKCNNCGRCTKVCQPGVLVMVNNKLQLVDVDQCNQCANCLKRCLMGAISLNG